MVWEVVLSVIPGAIALRWAYRHWRYDDTPEAKVYFRKFLFWGSLTFGLWLAGAIIDIHLGSK